MSFVSAAVVILAAHRLLLVLVAVSVGKKIVSLHRKRHNATIHRNDQRIARRSTVCVVARVVGYCVTQHLDKHGKNANCPRRIVIV